MRGILKPDSLSKSIPSQQNNAMLLMIKVKDKAAPGQTACGKSSEALPSTCAHKEDQDIL